MSNRVKFDKDSELTSKYLVALLLSVVTRILSLLFAVQLFSHWRRCSGSRLLGHTKEHRVSMRRQAPSNHSAVGGFAWCGKGKGGKTSLSSSSTEPEPSDSVVSVVSSSLEPDSVSLVASSTQSESSSDSVRFGQPRKIFVSSKCPRTGKIRKIVFFR